MEKGLMELRLWRSQGFENVGNEWTDRREFFGKYSLISLRRLDINAADKWLLFVRGDFTQIYAADQYSYTLKY